MTLHLATVQFEDVTTGDSMSPWGVLPFVAAILGADQNVSFKQLQDYLSLEELANTRLTVASKTGESASRASATVTLFTRKQIASMGVRSLEELLNYVPGF